MKRALKWLPLAAAFVGWVGAPAWAQNVSGQVTLNGSVAAKCGTITGATSFSGTINLGELSQANGTLSAAFSGSSANSPAGSTQFELGCSSANSTVTLSATELSTPALPPSSSFSNTIDYSVQVQVAMVAGGFQTVTYTTAATTPTATVQSITGPYDNIPGNFIVEVYGFSATNGASSFLLSGSYTGVITINVATAP